MLVFKDILLPIRFLLGTTTDEQARNNPRVDRATLGAFIESDLKKAEEFGGVNHRLPHRRADRTDAARQCCQRSKACLSFLCHAVRRTAKPGISNSISIPVSRGAVNARSAHPANGILFYKVNLAVIVPKLSFPLDGCRFPC